MRNPLIFLRLFTLVALLLSVINFGCSENVKKSIDDNDTGEGNDDSNNESLDIPVENDTLNITCSRRADSQMHEIRKAKHKQFPFMAAVISHQNEYLCSGSVLSNGLILTTAKCTLAPVSYVLLNATKAVKDDTTAMLHVIKMEKFPTYTSSESIKDVGLIYTEKHNSSVATKIRLSNYTSARNMNDVEALGYGLNAETGQAKEMQYVGLEIRSASDELVRAFFDCIETKVTTCFKDTGGPVIYENELVGIVTKGQEDCTKEMSASFAINKRMVDILPTYTYKAWLDEKIKKNEEQEERPLLTYPSHPVALRSSLHKMTDSGAEKSLGNTKATVFVMFTFLAICCY